MSKVFIQQTPQEIMNIIESLQFYKDNAVQPRYRHLIDLQINEISKQLQLQNINIYVKENDQQFNFGDVVNYEGESVLIIGMSNDNNFIKIARCVNNCFEKIDVPLVLLKKE